MVSLCAMPMLSLAEEAADSSEQADVGLTTAFSWLEDNEDTCEWDIDRDGLLVVRPIEGDQGTIDTRGWDSAPWHDYAEEIKSVRFEGVIKAPTCRYFFEDCCNLTTIDWGGLNTSETTDMCGMFSGCSSLTSLDLSGWDTSGVTDLSRMFYGCSSLTSLDLTGWDTSLVTGMSSMFYGCSSLASLEGVSGWNTGRCNIKKFEAYQLPADIDRSDMQERILF